MNAPIRAIWIAGAVAAVFTLTAAPKSGTTHAAAAYASLPVSFEANLGQAESALFRRTGAVGHIGSRVRTPRGLRIGDHQKWTAITLGGPAVPDITLAERTTCMFLLDQSLGAFFTASAKYAGLVRNSAAAEVP